MAVLPTPGSPISTGLFLVRRCSASRYLDRAANFVVTADHRIELALTGALGQVKSVYLRLSACRWRWPSLSKRMEMILQRMSLR
jgi:hypothetical protein